MFKYFWLDLFGHLYNVRFNGQFLKYHDHQNTFLFQKPMFWIHLSAWQVEAVLENELEEGLLKVNLTRCKGQIWKKRVILKSTWPLTRDNLDLKLTWDLEGEKMVLLEALQVPFLKRLNMKCLFFWGIFCWRLFRSQLRRYRTSKYYFSSGSLWKD